MAKIKIVEKNVGKKINYSISGTKVIFGEDELTVNLKSRERDYDVVLDICKDKEDGLTVGVSTGSTAYVAQIIIPARGYEIVETGEKDEQGKEITQRITKEFSITNCTLILWALV